MRIAVNGVELFFDVYGSGLAVRDGKFVAKPVVVALHGGPGIDHSQFVPWLTRLSDVAQVVLVDHRGNGRSSRPPDADCTLANMADDIEALRTTLGLGRIVVFGMSFGGMLALTYALAHPQGVAGLVLCATAASNESLERATAEMEAMASGDQRAALDRLMKGEIESAAALDRDFALLSSFYEYDSKRTPPGQVGAIANVAMLNWFFAHGRRSYDVRPRLGEIAAPTLVLTGRHDRITPPHASEEILKGIPHARQVLFEQSGHRLMREENDKFLDTVRDFLGRLDP